VLSAGTILRPIICGESAIGASVRCAGGFAPPGRGLWRYRHLLPARSTPPVSLGEGATPLVHLERLGRRLGLPRLYAKDESQNPTWSYKDRLCSTAVTHAVAIGGPAADGLAVVNLRAVPCRQISPPKNAGASWAISVGVLKRGPSTYGSAARIAP